MAQSTLYIVGIGPGGLNHMTFEAREALESADVVVGYKTYLDFISSLLVGKQVVSSGMLKEVDRCNQALSLACAGKTVALVSSGDAGVYGMAGLALELAETMATPPEIIIVPGVSAVQAAAAVLGAPLMHDFAVISLSDLLTPWATIEKRLKAAAEADFVIALYNPKSKGRTAQIEAARNIITPFRQAQTPVGIVRNACRDGETMVITTLGEMLEHPIDMFAIVIIGNTATYVDQKGRMVTPRGYETGARLESPGGSEKITSRKGAGNSSEPQSFDAKSRNSGIEPRSPDLESASGHAIMVCGTGSDVGKSVLCAGICRMLKRRGVRVAPFKSQNMALNSAVTPEGGEIGRAQAVQAEACGLEPHVDMNPVLLKPNSDVGSQVIVQGKVVGNMKVKEYNAYKPEAFVKIRESFAALRQRHEFIVIEGAGSIAEINLKSHDIANLKVADMADCPAILVADIDRGGVFAQIVGTYELLDQGERARLKGVIINKFRGDASLLQSGIDFVQARTGLPVLGVVPFFHGFRIADEDSVPLESRAAVARKNSGARDKLHIGVVRLSRMSNYTDFDALEREPDVFLHYVENPQQLKCLDLLILPGSKSTLNDLYMLMELGLHKAIRDFKGTVFGICGGYQMLGRRVLDPFKVESDITEAEGLGLLDVETVMLAQKETHQVAATLLAELDMGESGRELMGYEIHMGETSRGEGALPFARIGLRSNRVVDIEDGAVSKDGRVYGTYLHGIFDNTGFRTNFLNGLRRAKGLRERSKVIALKDPLDLLADHLERHVDVPQLLKICGLSGAKRSR